MNLHTYSHPGTHTMTEKNLLSRTERHVGPRGNIKILNIESRKEVDRDLRQRELHEHASAKG